MTHDKCNCSMSISLLGDGCRYCQSQEYIDRLHDSIDEDRKEIEHLETALQGLKDEVNRVWYLAYPQSPIDERDHAKMRVFNLYQDLVCTRDNYRFLNNAWNKLNEEIK